MIFDFIIHCYDKYIWGSYFKHYFINCISFCVLTVDVLLLQVVLELQ